MTKKSQLEHDAEISKLIKDVDAYRDILQKTESRLSTRIKELTVDVTKLVSISFFKQYLEFNIYIYRAKKMSNLEAS